MQAYIIELLSSLVPVAFYINWGNKKNSCFFKTHVVMQNWKMEA